MTINNHSMVKKSKIIIMFNALKIISWKTTCRSLKHKKNLTSYQLEPIYHRRKEVITTWVMI